MAGVVFIDPMTIELIKFKRYRFDETVHTEMKGSVIERIYLVVCSFVKSTSFDTELFAIRIIGRRYALRLLFIRLARSRTIRGNRFYRELLLSDSLADRRPVILPRQDLRAVTSRPHRHRSLIETSNDISPRVNCRFANIAVRN